jgi:hypothetical protein
MNLRHPVLLTLIAALILVLAGLYFVERQRAVAPTGSNSSWDTVSGYIEPTPNTETTVTEHELPDTAAEPAPEKLVIPKPSTGVTAKIIEKPGDESFDYNALLARLAHDDAPTHPQTAKTYEELIGAFTFVPSRQATAAPTRTAEQELLFAYGNEIGRRVQAFAAVNPNMSQTVVNQATHRDNKTYADAVIELGNRYKALGEGILSFHDVPVSAEAAHKALGDSYVNLGTALAAVPQASDDQAFIGAITSYNNKADAFTLAFVGMVNLFSTHDVTFDETDAGSAFSFRRN